MSKSKKKRRNKNDNTMLWILIVILIVCFSLIGFLFYKYFYAGSSTSKYGDTRLEGIENYPLSETLNDDIAKVYESESSVEKVTVNVKGRIIYITIDFKTAIKVDTAKSLASKALEPIGEKNLTYYEVQFLLDYTGEGESVFPIYGAKNANSLKVVWNNYAK